MWWLNRTEIIKKNSIKCLSKMSNRWNSDDGKKPQNQWRLKHRNSMCVVCFKRYSSSSKKNIIRKQLPINAYYASQQRERETRRKARNKNGSSMSSKQMCLQLSQIFLHILICNGSFSACVVLTFFDWNLEVYLFISLQVSWSNFYVQCTPPPRCWNTTLPSFVY